MQHLTNWRRTMWVMVLAQFMTAFGFAVIFPFLPLYVADLGSSTGASIELLAGLVFSAQAFAMMLASPLWGSVADRYGRKLMVQRAQFGGSIVILLMGFVPSAEMLIVLRGLQGLITGTVSATNALVAAETPREHVGYALGAVQTGFWTGIAAGPLVGGLVADSFGYRLPFIITAVMMLISGILVWYAVEETYSPTPKETKRPPLLVSWRKILVMPSVSLIFSLHFLNYLGRTATVPMLPLFILLIMPNTAWTGTMTGLVVGTTSLMTTLSSIYLGQLGDRIGYRPVLIVSALVAALAYLPQGFVTSAWQLLILRAVSGAAFGGVIPLLGALLAQHTPPGEEGIVYGLDGSIGSAARVIAPLVGATVALWLGLRLTFTVSGLMFFAIALLAMWGLGSRQV